MIVLTLCLGVTGALIHCRPEPRVVEKDVRLNSTFARIGYWQEQVDLGLDPQIVDALMVDDYLHKDYCNGKETVSLYIGYHLSDSGIGAPHSPLVCYPGQGWFISERERLVLEIGKNRLHLMSMIVSKGGKEDLVLYWFQAADHSSSGTFVQKIHAMWEKVTTGNLESAFIRISVPVTAGKKENARAVAIGFIREFYPRFLSYVNHDGRHPSGTQIGS